MTSKNLIKLDVGCGGRGSVYSDFIGIDIHPVPENPRSESEYLQIDFIKDELPFKDGSVSEVLASHIIEHLSPDDGLRLINKSLKLLSPGGKLYVLCPDLYLFCRKYILQDNDFYNKKYENGKDMWPGETLADKLNYQIHQATHIWSYDYDSLKALAERAGAVNIEPIQGHFYNKRPDHETGIIITK